jgi:hypothetical protein
MNGEPNYWKNVVFKIRLSIPYRWNHHNLVVHPSTDQAPLQFASRFPTGTQIRMCFKATNRKTWDTTPLFTSPWFDLPPPQ